MAQILGPTVKFSVVCAQWLVSALTFQTPSQLHTSCKSKCYSTPSQLHTTWKSNCYSPCIIYWFGGGWSLVQEGTIISVALCTGELSRLLIQPRQLETCDWYQNIDNKSTCGIMGSFQTSADKQRGLEKGG